MNKRLAAYAVAVALAVSVPMARAQETKRIAVFPFDTDAGIVQFWEGNFNPGQAMTAIVTNLLTKSNRYEVYDRRNLDKIAQEQNLGTGGQVTPETAAKVGAMTGVQYLVTGSITQFAATKQSGIGAVHIPGVPALGGGSSKRIAVTVEAHLTNVNTSQISAGLTGHGEDVVSSYAFGGFIPGADIGVGVESQEFESSGLGKAMYKAAGDLVAQMDTVQFKDRPAAPQVLGTIIDVDGPNYTLNVGSKDGVFKGMKFTVKRDKHIIDPTTNQPRTLHTEVGTMTVISVDTDTCTCKAGPSAPPFKVKDTAVLER